jgi:hypothetical protein
VVFAPYADYEPARAFGPAASARADLSAASSLLVPRREGVLVLRTHAVHITGE